MASFYRFVDLTAEQRVLRRDVLDHYGTVAQVSALVPMLVILCYRGTVYLCNARSMIPCDAAAISYRKQGRRRSSAPVARARVLIAWTTWWLGEPVEAKGWFRSTNGQLIGSAIWMTWLLALSFVQTGDDYLHLTKRFGIVGASQMPLHYLLAMKTPYSPLSWLMGISYSSLNTGHQLLGRMISILFLLHVSLYLNFYIISQILIGKLQETYIICGIAAFCCFIIIGTSALAYLRIRYYRMFYIIHIVSAAAVLPLLFFHVSHIRIYIYETSVLFALNVALRRWTALSTTARLRRIEGSRLVEIEIRASKSELLRWSPGQHAYISVHKWSHLAGRSNPFTLASIPTVDGSLRFITRVMAGNTVRLDQAATQQEGTGGLCRIYLEGPYGSKAHSRRLLQYDHVLFIAGGVGATFAAPLYRQLLADLGSNMASERGIRVRFLWIARVTSDIQWALPHGSRERAGFLERLTVHLTRDSADCATSVLSMNEGTDSLSDMELPSHREQASDDVELEQRSGLLHTEASLQEEYSGVEYRIGRPDLAEVIGQACTSGSKERVAILVCGPRVLSRAVRREAGQWLRRGKDIMLWEEEFSFS